MLFHLLFVLKLAPYVQDSEDWSAFLATLGLCLVSLGAYSMMLDLEHHQMEMIGIVTTVLPILCIAAVVCIMIFFDGGLWQRIAGRKKKNNQREESIANNNTLVVPVSVEKHDDRNGDNHFHFHTSPHTSQNDDSNILHRPLRSKSTLRKSSFIHDEFKKSEIALQAEQNKKQKKQRRNTQLRVMARLKIRKTKALTKVPLFKDVLPEAIDSILALTTYKKASKNTVLCSQGDLAKDFYIVVSGQCSVEVQVEDMVQRRVGTLKELDYFGESALLGGGVDVLPSTRNATVTVLTDFVQVLMLSRVNFDQLVAKGVLSNEIMTAVAKERERRKEMTRVVNH